MTDPKVIKAIVLDVDGTLLNSKSELTPRTEAALKAVQEKEIPIILATGKTRNSTDHLIEKLNLKGYGVYLQGAAIYDPEGNIVHQETLDPDLLRRVITYADDRGFEILIYSGRRIIGRAQSKALEDATVRYHEPLPESVGPLANIIGTIPVHKIMFVGDPRAVTSLRWQLNLQLGGQARLIQAGLPNMLEVLAPGAGKGAGVKTLLKDLKISHEHVMAIGDAENDIEMLKLAGSGVAMGQSEKAVKDAADHVTGTNDEDGAAQAIEQYLLKKDEKPAEPAASADGASAAKEIAVPAKEQSA
jgi:Cof subfamily protein (haloacid dehalogenase superfamily)